MVGAAVGRLVGGSVGRRVGRREVGACGVGGTTGATTGAGVRTKKGAMTVYVHKQASKASKRRSSKANQQG